MNCAGKKTSITAKTALFVVLILFGSIVLFVREKASRSASAVLVTGVHHMGKDFEVLRFFLDGFEFGRAGREGGGAGNICCVSLPKKWKQGLTVELRWEVADWRHAALAPTKGASYELVKRANFRASVPVERYQRAEHLWVHFFSDGRARVISSELPPENSMHPVADGDIAATTLATKGNAIKELFTQSETELFIRQLDAAHERHGRGWK